MKNIVLTLITCLFLTSAFAGAIEPVEGQIACTKCSMDRNVFAQSRMLVEYADGSSAGVCSLHCAAVEQRDNAGKQVSSLMVADFNTRKLLDARRAAWVVGGKQAGVMTSLAKWAFGKTEDALLFMKQNGGVLSSFEQAMNSAINEVLEQAAEEKSVENEMLREQHK
jgi:hypothetical protein